MSELTTDDTRTILRGLANKADADGLPAEVVEVLLAIADLEHEDHARALLFLVGVGRSFWNLIERAEEVQAGWN